MEYGKENIFINNRKGFIKYALQHGYTIALGYNFGEVPSPTHPPPPPLYIHLIIHARSPSIILLTNPPTHPSSQSDLYHTWTGLREWRLKLLKKTKIILFAAYGRWFFPLLPERKHPLNTVVGNPIDLPRIPPPHPGAD